MATKKKQPPAYLQQPSGFNFEAGDQFLASLKDSRPAAEEPQAGVLRTLGDMAIKGAQGVVGLGQSAVGLGNLATGGLIGKGMDALGYDPERTNAAMGEYLSDSQKASDAKVQAADGFVDTVATAVQNPRSIFGSVAQSTPGMFAGGAMSSFVARRIAAAAAAPLGGLGTEAGAAAAKAAVEAATGRLILAGAGTEGAQAAGQIAEQGQREGRGYGDYALPAVGAGALTTAIGYGAGKLVGDATTAAFTGSSKAGLSGSLPVRVAKSMASDGTEEVLQSGQEQAMTNLAMGNPIGEGVGNAAGMGLVTGAAMGGGMATVAGGRQPNTPAADPALLSPADTIRASESLPESGALARAVNAGVEAKAQAVEAGAPLAEEQQATAPAPEPVDDPVRDQILALPEGARQDALRAYAVLGRDDVAKGVLQYNRKLLDRLLAENAPPPVLGERLSDAGVDALPVGDTLTTSTDVADAMQTPGPVPEDQPMADFPLDQPTVDADGVVADQAGVFPTYEDAQAYVMGQRRNDSRITGLPVPAEGGGYKIAMKGDPEYVLGAELRAQRMQERERLRPDAKGPGAPASSDPVAERLQAAAAQGPSAIAPTDILNPAGLPFKTKMAADRAARQSPGAVVPVEGGFVVRPQGDSDVQDAPLSTPGTQAQAPADQAPQAVGEQPAGPAAGVPAARAGAVEAAGVADANKVGRKDSPQIAQPGSVATNDGPVRIGRDQVPLSDGGRPFKTRKAAGEAKAAQPMMRVVPVPGGYALAEKTQAQLAAEAKAAKRLARPNVSASGEPIPAHAFIAAARGLNPLAASDLGVDGNPRIGNRRLFAGAGRGMSMDQATQMLVADGYLSEGATVNDAFALIKRSLTQPQYNADGIERIAQQEAAAQFEDYLAAQEEAAQDDGFDPFGLPPELTAQDLEDEGYTQADAALQAEVRALMAQMEAEGIDPADILEDIARTYANATEDEYNAAARQALAAAIAQGSHNGGGPDAQTAPAPPSVQPDQGLTAPTRADIEAQQAVRHKAELDEAGRKRAADAAAAKEDERKRIAQASVRAADSFELGGDATENLTGQGALLGAADTSAPAKPAAEPAKIIADFGQKIGGARKDVWSGFKDDLNQVGDSDIAAQPLSKVWPAPDYQKLIDGGMDAKAVAAVRALRDEVPAKPRSAWKVKRWAEQVQTLRGLANDVMDGKITVQDMERMGASKGTSLRGMVGRIELYELVGHEKSLEGVRFAHHHYSLYRGRENVSMWVVEKDSAATAFSHWPTEIATGETKEQALAAFQQKYAALDLEKAARKASFDIFSERGVEGFLVGKKIGRNYAKLAGPFTTVKEARAYREGNSTALEEKLEKYKEIPRERADVNQPRVGQDMRNGQDVTPQMFGDTFGFKGVEFGNWVEQKRRQKDLNDAFDALMDMAAVLDIPPKAISLNGQLGLAFGARGSGGVNPAAAHYESDKVVINLTKKEGAGSLGHEWWHALDNYFAKPRTQGERFMTTSTDVGLASRGANYIPYAGVRKEMIDAFGAVVKAINQTAMKARSARLDSKRSKDYWGTGEELSARAFESYLIARLQDQNAANDYLANVVSQKTWDAMAALGMQNQDSYPYPTAAEIPAIRAGFDHFFQTVETKETDGGNVALFSRTPATHTAYEARIDALFAGDKPKPRGVRVLDRSDVLALLGMGDGPVHLVEGKVEQGRFNHALTAQDWKKVPEWLESPVAVFDSETSPGRLVFIAPELVRGAPVRMVIDPRPDGNGVNLLINAYEAVRNPFQRWEREGLLRYFDQQKAPSVTGSFQPRLAGLPGDRGRKKILTEKHLAGYRRANTPAFRADPPDTRSAQRRDSDARNVATQQLVDGLKEKWTRAPEIIVARNMQDSLVPPRVRDYDAELKSQGSDGEARGFIYKGKVYLLSDQLHGPEQIAEVLFHEVLGHYGLRGAFGDGLTPILQQLGILRRKEVVAKAREYGMVDKGLGDAEAWAAMGAQDRLSAAEEVLAEMAQAQPTIGFVQRAVAAIRSWLRANVPGFKDLALTDDEIVRSYLLPARGHVTRSQETPEQSIERAMAAFSRSAGGDTPMFSRSKLSTLKASALDQIHQTLSHPGKVSLWDKSVGTMRHLAERAPAFKPVFESAQRFIDDVSTLANDAADQAPRLLPRVETLSDLKKKPITAADNKAIAKPLFEGTLMWGRDVHGKPVLVDDLTKQYADLPAQKKAQLLLATDRITEGVLKMWQGLPLDQYEALVNSRFESKMLKPGVVWTDAELKSLFNATPAQVELYHEARQAIDRSIDMTARADMLRAMGQDYAALRDALLEAPTLQDAMALATDTLQQDARDNPDAADRLMAVSNQVVSRYEAATALQEQGYAPLSRFGKYTVDVVDTAGERQYFGMFESMREANQMAAKMRGAFPGAEVTSGTMSQQAYKLFAGITPESLELFGNMLGLQSEGSQARDKAFQEYLQLAKNNASALKRLIHRQGIAGYSEDVGRVLASFVYANARQAAGGLNAGTMEGAINAIPKEQGELKDVAMGLQGYISDPQEEGQAVRGMLFAQYLGGSVASAFVNMTQPFAVTMPYLSQFGGMRKAAAQLARAVKDVGSKDFKGEPDLSIALRHAVEDGTVAPQEIHQLMAQARGTGSLRVGDGTTAGDARAAAANTWERVKVAWGQPFALAEQFNRRSTFIAAYRMAKAQGHQSPAEFARKAVLETQFLYSKANKSRWQRGAVGGTLMTFKTYSISYLELLQRMWTQGGPEGKRAVAWAMAMLMLMGGAGGLPFAEDAEDLIDALAQMMGYNVSAKQWRKQAMADILGKELAEFLDQGVSGLPGSPVDVSGRLGMGNLVPGTGLFQTKQSHTRDMLELAGPAGDLVGRMFTGAGKVLKGVASLDAAQVAAGALEVAPTAARNAAKGVDMAATGMYRDTKGYKVLDTTLAEAAAKFAGFQPRSVAEVQEANSFTMRSKSFYTQTSGEISAQWAQALFEKDDAGLQAARARLEAWNRNNPDQRITVKMPSIVKRVREMGKDRTQRIADSAPKALRQKLREDAARALVQ